MMAPDDMMMRIARIALAFVIALSVATLPMAASASISVKPTEIAVSTISTTGAEMSPAMDDCCPDHAKPCDQHSDHCQSMSSCGLQSVNLADVAVSRLKYPTLPGNPVPMLTDQAVPSHGGSPPFRPPRV